MRCGVVLCVVVGSALLTTAGGSAIPMWEFLSRTEKMAHLFNMFGKQVKDYCDSQSMPDCNKVLLVYGMTNLAKMNEDSLDKMDPYQRGAHDIVWDSMMKGTFKPGGGENNNNNNNNNQNNNHNSKDTEDFYSTGSEALEPSVPNAGNSLGSQESASNVEQYLSPAPGRFVIGPMVVRVMPDGRPVPSEFQPPMPKDEDAEEFKEMRSKPMPSMEDILRGDSRPSSERQRARPAYSLPAQFRIHSI